MLEKSLEGRRILLVGGAGFIGHNLALALSRLNAHVLIIDSLFHNNYYALKKNPDLVPYPEFYMNIIEERFKLLKKNKITIKELDARDYHALTREVVDFKPDALIQLAAIAHAGKSNKDPYTTFDNSLRTLENALDVSRDIVKHFVFFSSSMVYGDFDSETVTEESPCNPIGIYGALKYAGEKIVIAYNQVFGLPYTIIRPSALYGERCISRRVGQIFIENALKDMDIKIEGDGGERLDFTYIQDLVSGVIKVLQNENAKQQIFNMTYGQSQSLFNMASILRDYFPQAKINYLERDKLMPKRGTLSVEKAKKLIGYNPQYPLEKGFPKYIEWYQSIYKKSF